MLPDQKSKPQKNKTDEPVIPETAPINPVDPDEVVHELPDQEPEIPADPDDLVHTFPAKQEITNMEDIDDLIHPPAIDGEEAE